MLLTSGQSDTALCTMLAMRAIEFWAVSHCTLQLLAMHALGSWESLICILLALKFPRSKLTLE